MDWNEAINWGKMPQEWKNFEDINFNRQDLSGKLLLGCDFTNAIIQQAELPYTNVTDAKFTQASLRQSNMEGIHGEDTDFKQADLSHVNMRSAVLVKANFEDANFYRANLACATLAGSSLRGATFTYALCTGCDFSGCDFTNCDMFHVDLRGANLSGAIGILDPREWLESHFEFDPEGMIVYKVLGDTAYPHPGHWKIGEGLYLTEVVNPDRATECGCGVNFATAQWCVQTYHNAQLWKCRIEWRDLVSVVVPYGTDGKARCARLKLLERE